MCTVYIEFHTLLHTLLLLATKNYKRCSYAIKGLLNAEVQRSTNGSLLTQLISIASTLQTRSILSTRRPGAQIADFSLQLTPPLTLGRH